jgi:hypothetical protein
MAPRANWKGYLRLSLVSCPILLYPATSDAEKVRFNQIKQCDESDGRTERSGQSEKKRKVLAGYHGRNNGRGRYAAAEPRIPSDGVSGFREAFLPRQC